MKSKARATRNTTVRLPLDLAEWLDRQATERTRAAHAAGGKRVSVNDVVVELVARGRQETTT